MPQYASGKSCQIGQPRYWRVRVRYSDSSMASGHDTAIMEGIAPDAQSAMSAAMAACSGALEVVCVDFAGVLDFDTREARP